MKPYSLAKGRPPWVVARDDRARILEALDTTKLMTLTQVIRVSGVPKGRVQDCLRILVDNRLVWTKFLPRAGRPDVGVYGYRRKK